MTSLERKVSPNRRSAPNAAARHSRFPQQRRADALALPAVVDRQAEFETCGIGLEAIAGLADDGLKAVDAHDRDHAETIVLAGMDEMIELGLRQFAHGAEEAVVAGAHRQRPEVGLQFLGVPRLDKAHRHGLAVAQPQDIGMLPEVVETKRCHRRLPSIPKRRRPASLSRGDAGLGCCLSPPERLFGLVNDVAPGKADVVQVAIGPLGQFAPLALTVAPDMKVSLSWAKSPEP